MMKQAILTGKIEPGEAIVENKVAQDPGVGTPLVREALIELEHQGFVQRFPYRATYVTKLSPAC
jgi:DNA-binding GntR family transcriptional regulator